MTMFSKIKAVLIDLSGTVHIESAEIPGSIEALQRYCFVLFSTLLISFFPLQIETIRSKVQVCYKHNKGIAKCSIFTSQDDRFRHSQRGDFHIVDCGPEFYPQTTAQATVDD